MPSVQAKMMNKIFAMIPAEAPDAVHDYVKEREQNASRKPPKAPRGVSLQLTDFHGIDGEIITPKKPDAGKVIWYIHGGGFTTGSALERRALTYYLADKYGYTVIANNYRLSPENQWPAQLDDCMKAYEGIVQQGYDMSQVVLMGESAGGSLVLSVALRIRDEGKKLPKAVVAFSPVTNQAEALPSHTENVPTDYMLKDALLRPGQNIAVFGDANPSEELMRSPYVSPYFGDYTGLPPIFLAASDTEVLYDDSTSLYQKLSQEDHKVQLDVAHGVCHAYPLFPQMPEAVKTIKRAMAFIQQ